MRFGHFLGQALWIGGVAAALVLGAAARRGPAARANTALMLLGRLHVLVVAPGAVITAATGMLLTMALTTRGMSAVLGTPGMVAMQGLGLLAAVLAVFVALPTANQLAAAAQAAGDSDLPAVGRRLQLREARVTQGAGVLALAALLLGVLFR